MRFRIFSRRLWNRDFILINLVCCVASYPNSILQTLLSVYILDLGGSNAVTGFMMTGFTILTMVTNIVVAPLIDRIGRKKLLVLGSGLFFFNTLLFCFTDNLAFIFVLRVLCGFTTGVFFPIPPIVVSDISSDDLLVDAMGIFGAAGSIAFAVTPAIGLAFYNNYGPAAMFLSGAVMGGISFILSFFIEEHYRRPAAVQAAGGGAKISVISLELLPVMVLPMLVNLIICFGNSAVGNFLTPCGLSRGLGQISIYFIVNQGVCIVTRLLVGSVLGRISKRTCTLAGIFLAGAGTAVIAFSYNMLFMIVSAVLVGVGFTVVTQIFQAESFSTVPGDCRGLAGTAFMLSGSIGSGLGSLVWGAVSAGMGYTAAYVLAGVSAFVSFVFHRMYWRKEGR